MVLSLINYDSQNNKQANTCANGHIVSMLASTRRPNSGLADLSLKSGPNLMLHALFLND